MAGEYTIPTGDAQGEQSGVLRRSSRVAARQFSQGLESPITSADMATSPVASFSDARKRPASLSRDDIEGAPMSKKPAISATALVASPSLTPFSESFPASGLEVASIRTASVNDGPEEMNGSIMTLVPGSKMQQADRAPLATSDSRAAMAETLPYFRSFQGGAYVKDERVWALLVSGAKMERPHFDGDVIITRSGGHHAMVGGKLKQVKNASDTDAQVKAFNNNMRNRIPIVVIVGKDNESCPAELKHEYSVCGWFQITSVWSEFGGERIGYRYRLERIRRAGNEDWWTKNNDASTLPGGESHMICESKVCGDCRRPSKRVFEAMWLCLWEDCRSYWRFEGRLPRDPEIPTYNPRFLAERHAYPDQIAMPFDIAPAEPKLSKGDAIFGGGFDRRMWKGFMCSNCRHISPRRMWHSFRCDKCGAVKEVNQPPISMDIIRSAHTIPFTGHALCSNYYNSDVIGYTAFLKGWYVFRKYDLGHGNFVYHIQSNEKLNEAPGGPNEILHKLQTDKSLRLERRSLGNKQGKAEQLVNHFSKNFGLPYKYIVGQDSRPFSDAPDVVLNGLERLQWVANTAIGRGNFEMFNEVLAVGYFEEGSMGYHDDGEDTLGDTVAALCEGGDATMKIRIKDQYFKGYNKGRHAIHPSIRVPEGALLEDKRNALREDFNKPDKTWDASAKADYEKRLLKLYADAKKGGLKVPAECKPILELNFRHGDFFIMHGKDIQQIYEHGLTMDSKLRFALTARHVLPSKISPEYHHYGDFDAEKFTYDGSKDADPPSSTEFYVPTNEKEISFIS